MKRKSHHRSSRDAVGSGGAADPCASDAGSGGEDVDDAAIVGERASDIANGAGTDSDCRGLASGGSVLGVDVVIAGSDNNVNSTGGELGDGVNDHNTKPEKKDLTVLTALSNAVAVLPPRDIDTTEGRPEALA